MSLFTNFQTVKDKIDDAKEWTDKILQYKDSYTELEYIESTGTQYIVTDIIPGYNKKLEVTFQYSSNTQNVDDRVFVTQESNPFLLFGRFENKFRFVYGNTSVVSSLSQDTNRHTAYYDTSFKIDTTTYVSGLSQVDTAVLKLFSNGSGFSANGLRIFSVKQYDTDGTTLIHDYIPVKDKSSLICLYDKITNIYYYNSGTGSFIAGPEIGEV